MQVAAISESVLADLVHAIAGSNVSNVIITAESIRSYLINAVLDSNITVAL